MLQPQQILTLRLGEPHIVAVSATHMTLVGEATWKPMRVSQDLPPTPLLSASFNLCPLAVISHNHEAEFYGSF